MTMTPDDLEQRKGTLELLNGEMASRLTRQSESLAKIDTKTVFLVGFAATAAQFLATHQHHQGLAYLAFVFYAVTLLAGVLSIRVSGYEDLEPKRMVQDNVNSPESRVLAAMVATRVTIFEDNRKRHDRKARYWTVSRWSLVAGRWSLVVGLGLSTVALLLQNQDHEQRTEPARQPASCSAAPAAPCSGAAAGLRRGLH
ncbi:hypothetical protein [Streptomyces sp. NPDC002176]|uniref:hypothetical protein n=1 Tax=Streptomyces sp. NPDC002176 TaxID=3364634 RepID=UPI00384D1997